MSWWKNSLSKLSLSKKRKKTYSELYRALEYKNKRTDSHWRTAYLVLRIVWAFVPLALLIASAVFTFWLVDGIGHGHLSFKGYEEFINLIALDILAHVVSIVVIVMRFLFPNRKSGGGDPKVDDSTDNDLFELPSLRG